MSSELQGTAMIVLVGVTILMLAYYDRRIKRRFLRGRRRRRRRTHRLLVLR